MLDRTYEFAYQSRLPLVMRILLAITSAVEKVETWLGFFFQNVLTLGLGGILIVMLTGPGSEGKAEQRILWTMIAFWIMLDVPSLRYLWPTAFSERRPLF